MKRVVILEAEEWRRLPHELATELHRYFVRDGVEIRCEGLKDQNDVLKYLIGSLVLALADVTEKDAA